MERAEPSPFIKNATQKRSLSFMELWPEPILTPLLVDFFYLTDYYRSVTIVSKNQNDHFHSENWPIIPENWPISALFLELKML